jgi:uncharacterized pyridoxamine 5'-phosphate oxidase family protein
MKIINNENNEIINDDSDCHMYNNDSEYYLINDDDDDDDIIRPLVKSIKNKLCPRDEIYLTLEQYNFKLLKYSELIEMCQIHNEYTVYNAMQEMKADNVATICSVSYNLDDITLQELNGYKDIMIFFSPDGKNLINIAMPSIDIFKGFVNETKFPGKRKCDICYNKEFKKLWVCSNCSKKHVRHVFPNCLIMLCAHTVDIR